MLKLITDGFAKQCTAKAKSTQQRCQRLAAYGQGVCTSHGANRHPVSGKDSHFYVHGNETRAERKARPAKLKKAKEEIRQCEKLLADDKPIFELPFDTPIAKAINRAMERALGRIAKNAVRIIDKKYKTTSKKLPVTGAIK